MTEPAGAVLSRSRLVRVPRRLRRRRSSGSFFIFIESRLAGPGDLVRDVLVGVLAGAAAVGRAGVRGLGLGYEARAHLESGVCGLYMLTGVNVTIKHSVPTLGDWAFWLRGGWLCS